ncbi:terminase [Mesorhizobium sp. M2D.F.Ca.ET.223.01.1.1]|uniref:terminase large subunit domain-containing protein n=1 Tax=Mesorhizobium sp. M2D.F.Ca.ET.223.01.1.1 TaxID=2563940 RepID=UPI0010925228|nr:terminase family protein [Mesorhizobium sp. M2D.F.Ca.ET.223.01.1.1]TGR83583.1 terminase [Mesorhizobium sp. M2D.F.Ca.ET.223.01.1.1]TGT75184.1 terminase [bacterium M00.F.Ca.ET.159.01.1.1]TGT88051.1 terminase [bacterium M00.F.Ca.ET.157.01.1.1]
MPASAAIDLHFHKKQTLAFHSTATEILYGGAAGGGKSHLMRQAAIMWCAEIPGLQVYLFRRISDDLTKNHMEGPQGFRALLAGWVACGWVEIIEDEIRFWNGSKIFLCHCKDEKHRFKYQGAEIHVLLIDELTHFTEVIYRYLRMRVRMVGIKLPEKYKGCFPRILCGANPGGIGHQFVKQTFVDGAVPMEIRQAAKSEGGMRRQFIPALLEDNPSMNDNDPEYENRLHGLGSEALVRAMRYGDWDVIEGAFFDNMDRRRHVIRPFQIPEHWTRFRAGDWGSAKPFAFGWYAVASDDTIVAPGIVIPRGALVKYREWYGIKTDKDGQYKPDTGLKMHADAVGAGVRERDGTDVISYGVLDPAAFSQDGGPSIAERMARGTDGKNGATFRPADNARVAGRGAMGGWDQMRGRLTGDEDGRPMLFFFETCVHTIRTIPALQHDENRPEDLDTTQEDHAADETRYACMSRPWTAKPPAKPKPKLQPGQVLLPGPPEERTGTRISV